MKKKEKKVSKKSKCVINKYYIASIVVSILMGVLAGYLLYYMITIKGVFSYEMTLIVGDHIGFDTGTEKIAFGMVMPGASSSTRYLVVSNNYKYPVRVTIEKKGKMAEWVVIDENNFILNGMENKTIPLLANVPAGTAYGNYTGKLKVTFKLP